MRDRKAVTLLQTFIFSLVCVYFSEKAGYSKYIDSEYKC